MKMAYGNLKFWTSADMSEKRCEMLFVNRVQYLPSCRSPLWMKVSSNGNANREQRGL
eukprot:IDg10360t1